MYLTEAVNDFFELIKNGETTTAIQKFYHKDAEQIENVAPGVKGKQLLLEAEENNIKGVNWFSIKIPAFIIDEKTNTVMGEMVIDFENKEGITKRLEEAFVQKWKDCKIIYQRFYYNTFINVR